MGGIPEEIRELMRSGVEEGRTVRYADLEGADLRNIDWSKLGLGMEDVAFEDLPEDMREGPRMVNMDGDWDDEEGDAGDDDDDDDEGGGGEDDVDDDEIVEDVIVEMDEETGQWTERVERMTRRELVAREAREDELEREYRREMRAKAEEKRRRRNREKAEAEKREGKNAEEEVIVPPPPPGMDEFLAQEDRKLADSDSDSDADGGGAGERSGSPSGPDWLVTRRSRLASSARAVGMLPPADAAAARELDSEIPPVRRTLLTSDEIMRCASALGGRDVRLVVPDLEPDGTRPLGRDGLVLVTADGPAHVRVIADAVARNLKRRDLGSVGVMGARLGPEGGEDSMTSRRNRKRAGLSGRRVEDGWMAVDCGNYVVHVQDDETRRDVDLEGLWRGGEIRRLRSMSRRERYDEDVMDDYVSMNPVPEAYARKVMMDDAAAGVGPVFGRRNKAERWTPTPTGKKKQRPGGKKGRGRRWR